MNLRRHMPAKFFFLNQLKGEIMNKKNYEKLQSYFSRHKKTGRLLQGVNLAATMPAFVMYPLLLVYLLRRKDPGFKTSLLIPASTFFLVSVFRNAVNRKRPYEAYQIPPLINKEKKGHSFPSRHVFSSFLIAVLWLPVVPAAGIFLLLISILVALVRVLGGVHYISDVLAGALVGCLSGLAANFIRKI